MMLIADWSVHWDCERTIEISDHGLPNNIEEFRISPNFTFPWEPMGSGVFKFSLQAGQLALKRGRYFE
jgi:hypothetical protein